MAKGPLPGEYKILSLFLVPLVNSVHCNKLFRQDLCRHMCGGGDGDVIMERRKRCGVAILLSAIKTIDSFCLQLLDTDSITDDNSWLLLLHINVLHPFPHYHFPKGPL